MTEPAIWLCAIFAATVVALVHASRSRLTASAPRQRPPRRGSCRTCAAWNATTDGQRLDDRQHQETCECQRNNRFTKTLGHGHCWEWIPMEESNDV